MSAPPPLSVAGAAPLALSLAATLLAVPAVLGQDEGPIVITQEREYTFLGLSHVDVALEFIGEFRKDEIEPSGLPKTRDRQDSFRGIIELETEGFIYHPNLVELTLGGAFEYEYEDFDLESEDQDFSKTDEIFQYDVTARILRESKVPVELYALRFETQIGRAFGGNLDSRLKEYGGRVSLRSDAIPSSVQYAHREQRQRGITGITEFEREQDRVDWQTIARPGDRQLLTWDYFYEDIKQSGSRSRDTAFRRHDGFLVHTLDFGPRERASQLRTTVKGLHQRGDFELDRLRLSEALRLRSSPDLETRFDYLLDYQDREGAEQTLHVASAGFRHELFDSLITTGNVRKSWLDLAAPDGIDEETFAGVVFDYTKEVPLGLLRATGTLSVNSRDTDERGQTVNVLDEPHTFPPSGIIVLEGQTIVASSIVVTDITNTIVYAEGFDYRVLEFQDRVEIRLIIGGSLSIGQTVLVDYAVGPVPANTTDTTVRSISARYDLEEGPFAGLSFYTLYRQQDQSLDIELPELVAEDVDQWVTGVEYYRGPFTFKAEYEDYDSSISPFQARRLQAILALDLGLGSGLNFTATYDDIERPTEGTDASVTYVSAQWIQKLSRNLSLDLEILYRYEDESQGTDVESFEQRLDVYWNYRQTTIFANFRNAWIDSDVTDSLFQRIVVGVRREF